MKSRFTVLEPRWLVVISFFIAGVFLGGLSTYLYWNTGQSVSQKIHGRSSFKYINPLLAVDLYSNQQFSQNASLAVQLQGIINANKNSGAINDAGVYFRDIEPGYWVGINDGISFSPGKLLKIPIMIAYFKLAESDPAMLTDHLTFNGSDANSKEIFPVKKTLEAGRSYTVNELIERMIISSDNNAAIMLYDFIDKSSLDEVFSDLGINFKEDKNAQDFISLKLYSLFFRVLYNATYLSREYSDKALGLLVKTDDPGLSGGLPKNIDFADRFGAHKVQEGLIEMYDCGIVYYPNHPYFICATARGKNLDRLLKFFTDVAKTAYSEIDYKYKRVF